GGTSGGPTGTALDSFESANINADGTLGPFMKWTGRNLVTPRAGLSVLRAGRFMVALGGWNNLDTVYDTVELADINGDGTGIQTFNTAPSVMKKARYLATARVIADYLYVFGGAISG